MNATKKRAIALHSKVVRARAGMCEFCTARGFRDQDGLPIVGLDCAHIITRNHGLLVTDVGNAFCLCRVCSSWFTDHPTDFIRWAISKIGKHAYDRLVEQARPSTARPDWATEVVRLTRLLKPMKTAA